MKIYLDTNLWNALCDQSVDPRHLVTKLAAKNATVVLSGHLVFELARTFRMNRSQALPRGRQLFRYISEFADANTPCVKEIMDLLVAEVEALEPRTGSVDPFIGNEGYQKLRAELEKLATYSLDQNAHDFINERDEFALNTRLNQARHLEGRPDMKEELKLVAENDLKEWLQKETLTGAGAAILVGHLVRVFDGIPQIQAAKLAVELIGSPRGCIARGIVRADLYYNWRCANRGSNPKDLIVDAYHILNSIYCDVYATGEAKQADYAHLLLTGDMRVAVYDEKTQIHLWLMDLI